MTIYIGIDPGLDGAIASVTLGEKVQVVDTPTFKVTGKKTYRQFDLAAMRQILLGMYSYGCLVCMEQVHSMPEQGVASSFNFGRGYGLWEGLIVGLGFRYTLVTPQRWKKVMLDGMGKEKGASILVAKRLFPNVLLDRKKDHGRADALLIAEYARRTQ